jgi:hypothetical protein
MTGGQTLKIQTSGVTGGYYGDLSLDVYAPAITDGTVASASVALSEGNPLTFVAPYSGTWTLLVTAPNGDATISYNYIAAIEAARGAAANGAATIASAPNLLLEKTISSGWSDQQVVGNAEGEFWRVPMTAGQTLKIQTSGVFGGYYGSLSLQMYAPEITDGTVATAKATAMEGNQLTFVAPSSGTWTLLVTAPNGNRTISYDYVASVSGAASAPGNTSTVTPSSVAIAHQDSSVTSAIQRVTVTIAVASFSGLAAGAHEVAITLNSKGLRLLRRDGERLSAAALVAYSAGGAIETTHATILLKGAKAKKVGSRS